MSLEIMRILFISVFFLFLADLKKPKTQTTPPPVFSFLWIWHPVQSRVLHGSLAATASQPLAVHAHAQAHHHPELQHEKLPRRQACPQRGLAAAHISRCSSRSNRGQHPPPEHHQPCSSHQAKSAHRLVNPPVFLRQIKAYHSDVSPDVCGQLLLEPSGTVDLRDVHGHCTVSIGRPLDEVIDVKVESGSLSCKLQSNSYQI